VPESDHLTLLHVYQQWKNNGYRGDWCARHYLQGKGLKKAKEVSAMKMKSKASDAWQQPLLFGFWYVYCSVTIVLKRGLHYLQGKGLKQAKEVSAVAHCNQVLKPTSSAAPAAAAAA
jgi:hypothetical protein